MSVAPPTPLQHPTLAAAGPSRATASGAMPPVASGVLAPEPREPAPVRAAEPPGPVLNPVLRIDMATNVVVIEWWHDNEVARQIPTERELKAYHAGGASDFLPQAAGSNTDKPASPDTRSVRLDVVT